ncbi:MAG: glycosyltransferase family 4 protein [Flavobacteriales bacterium]|nr:glycosyltransferase family 4 protein [Flavobacteriales bacterium]
MSTNILYLSYDGMTDSLGQSQVLPYLKGLTKEGYKFHIISFEKPDRFEKFRNEIQLICDSNNITWHPLTYTKNPPLLSTIYDVRRMRSLARSLHALHDFKIIHCRSYLSAMVGLGMKRSFGTKFLFDMRGFWADERVEGKIWSLKNPVFKLVYNFFKKKEKDYFLNADYIVSLTHAGKKEITSWKGFEHLENRMEVIPCCVDLEKFDPSKITPEEKEEARATFNFSSNDLILGYVGSIGTWYMLDEMLQFFKTYLSKYPTAKLLFISGENRSIIDERAKTFGIDENLIFVKSVLHSEVPKYISIFDASVFFIIPTFSKTASSPTKQGELMAMGIPIFCNSGVGDTEWVVNEYHAGDAMALEHNMDYSKFDFNLSNFNIEQTKLGAKEFYGLETGVSRYLKIYNYLSSKK